MEGEDSNSNPVRVFISYNREDGRHARDIASLLNDEGIPVWFDEWEIAPGDSIPQSIEAGLDACTHLILVWSKNAVASDWVTAERESFLYINIDENKKKTIPILLNRTPLPTMLKRARYLRYDIGAEELKRELLWGILGRNPWKTIQTQIAVAKSEIAEIVRIGENDRIEFKSRIPPSLVIARTVAGFLNTVGGIIVIGVMDSKEIIGINRADMQLTQYIKSSLTHLLDSSSLLSKVRIEFHEISNKRVCVIRVDESEEPVFLKVGESSQFIVRRGSRLEILRDAREIRNALSHLGKSPRDY